MDSATDPLAAVSASAPFPTIPAAVSPRPRAGRPRRHAAPFRSDHPASAATSTSRRYESDVSRRSAASSFALQEGSPSVGSWGTSGDANFVFGSGVTGASETTKSLSSGSGEGSLSNLSSVVDKLALDGFCRQSDTDASVPVLVVNVDDRLCTSGSNSSYSLDDHAEQVDEGSGVLSPTITIRCQSVETRSLASQAVDASPPCTDGNISTKFGKDDNSLPVQNSVDEGNFAKDGSKISAHGGAHQNFFVFGEHAGYQQFTANADQPDVNEVDAADKNGVTYRSEQLNDSAAKDSTCTKFILQDAEHASGLGDKDSSHTELQEISAALEASDAVPSNLGYEDARANVSFNNSTLKTVESSPDGTEFMPSAKMEQPDQSGFTFSASTFDQIFHILDCSMCARGNQAFAEGQLTKAEECYTHGIDSFSSTEASRKALMLCYSNRAAARMSLGKMREALSDCREAIDIDSCFLKAQVRAAKSEDCQQITGKITVCQSSIGWNNDHCGMISNAIDTKLSGFILQSKEYLVTKAFDKIPSALQMISDALSISNYSDNLMAMKAEALLLLRQYEEVIRFCQETVYLAERNSICFGPEEHLESKNLDTNCCSGKLWRYHLIAKSYFFLGKLEEAQQFIKKYEQTKVTECRCQKQSQQSISSFSTAISELQQLKALSRRSGLYELLRDYDQAANDLHRLISLLEKQLQENMSMPSEQIESIHSNLNRANLRLASLERDARKGATLNMYLILGIEPSCSAVDIKKAYRKAALRHHPDKTGKSLVRSENINDALWREITNDIRRDADYLFKLIGKAYAMLSDPTMSYCAL
ncbi:hypothetical protein PR202_gb26938 [Eleusine coracana subsp. coracana]|uniref:J domain-containing protein n=1 Tax=Eleusine coracana subsp. coracana TaxID=191504 RepID=A0AAV5FSG0_ELECO|nr:hypothetical protein PR202_gb26938 [Eleusine coracana subsp. coracana]